MAYERCCYLGGAVVPVAEAARRPVRWLNGGGLKSRCGLLALRWSSGFLLARLEKEFSAMWRSLFLAVGIMAIIVGLECLMIENATLYAAGESSAREFANPAGSPARSTQTWQPAEWFPWAVLSTGAVIVLYAFTLPRRWHQPTGE